MAWSVETSEGFLLAATVSGDRLAAQGIDRIAGRARASVETLVADLSALSRHERRMKIEAMSQRTTAPLGTSPTELPPRALALLAPIAERGLANEWLRQGPSPRIGYRAEAGLRQVLRAIAEEG